jgi:hypothetical protein
MVAFQGEIISFCHTAVCDLGHMTITAPNLTRWRMPFKTFRPIYLRPVYLGVVA